MTTPTKTPAEWIETIDEQIASKHDEAQAIANAVAGGDGAWSDEQAARYQAIMGEPGDEENGEIGKLHAQRANWTNVEREQERLAKARAREQAAAVDASRAASSLVQVPQGVHNSMGIYALGSNRPIQVPSNARCYRRLPVGCETPEAAYAMGMWMTAALFDWEPAVAFCKKHGIDIIRDQQEIGTPGKGGYLVPVELERTIIQIREMYGIMRRHARIYRMGATTLDLPKDMNGITVSPASERSDLKANNSTSKDWTLPQLVANKWAGYTTWSTELDEDAIIDIAADLARDYGRAFAYAEDNAGFNGDGGGSFNSITGIRNALLASSKVTAASNAGPGSLTDAEFFEMIGKTPNLDSDDQAWYCHKTVWAQGIQPLAQAGGGNTIRDLEMGANTSPGGSGDRPNFMFQGYPGYWSSVMPKAQDFTGSLAGVVIFGSLNRGVAFGDRRGLNIAFSQHAEFATDEWAIRGTERFDLLVHETGTATASDPAGTIVQLDLPA